MPSLFAGSEVTAEVIERCDHAHLAHLFALAGEAERVGDDGATVVDADAQGADRHAVLLGGTGHPGERQPYIGAENVPHAAGHRRGRRLADHRADRNVEELELDLAGLRHHCSAQDVTGSRHGRQASGNQSPGDRLRQAEREAAIA